MPWGPNSFRKYSWKEAAGGGRNRNENERSWRKTDSGKSKSPDQSFISRLRERGVFRNIGSACAAVFGIVLIGWLLTMPGCTKTEILVVTFPGHEDGVAPPKNFAGNDAAAFERVRSNPNYSGKNLTWDKLDDYLKTVDRDKVLVLFISAHGVTGGDGNTYLLPNKADPDDQESYLSLKKLWITLKQNKQIKEQKKLVLLDICQIRNEWRLGLFDNVALENLETEFKNVPNLVVLSSCTPGEKSWSGDYFNVGRGQSVFGYYVTQGFSGHADTDDDRQLTLKELYDYLKTHTDIWVSKNRDRSGQHPKMFSTEEENQVLKWELASLSRSRKEDSAGNDEAGRETIAKLKQRIHESWKKHEELAEKIPYQFDPLGWRVLTDRLLLAEDWLDSGETEVTDKILNAVERDIRRVKGQIEQGRFEDFSRSFPFVYENIVRRIWDNLQPLSGETAGRVTKLPENFLLDDLCRDQPEGTKTLANKDASRIRKQAEDVVSFSLRTLQPVREMLAEADNQRRLGEDYLFIPDSQLAEKHLKNAEQEYREANRIRTILNDAHKLRINLSSDLYYLANWSAHRHPVTQVQIRGASQDQFRSNVMKRFQQNVQPGPDDFRELYPQNKGEGSSNIDENEIRFNHAEVSLLILFHDARKLEELLAKFDVIRNPEELSQLDNELRELRTLTDKSEQLLSELKTEIRDVAMKMEKANTTAQLEYRQQIKDILRCPFLLPDLRNNLKDMSEITSRKMADNTNFTPTSSQADSSSDYVDGEWSALWAIQVLSLGPQNWAASPSPDRGIVLDRLQEDWKSVRGERESLEKKKLILLLGDEIRRAWKEKADIVRETMNSVNRPSDNPSNDQDNIRIIRAQLSKADRMAGTLHPWDARQLGLLNPTLEFHRFLMTDLLITHADRYLEDFWDGWYQQAVNECLNAADKTLHPAYQTRLKSTKTTRDLRLQAKMAIKKSSFPVGFQRDSVAQLSPNVVRSGPLPKGQAAIWLTLNKKAQDYIQEKSSSRRPISTQDDMEPERLTLNRKKVAAGSPSSLPTSVSGKFEIFFRGHKWGGACLNRSANSQRAGRDLYPDNK